MACLTNYTIGCTDVTSGKTGSFFYDSEHWQKTGQFKAVSPVFPSLVEFYKWDDENGCKRKSCYLERTAN